VAVVIPLKLVYTPVDDTVTAIRNYQVPSTWDSDRRVTVNNIQVMLVCGRPGDRGGGTETPAASVSNDVNLQSTEFDPCR